MILTMQTKINTSVSGTILAIVLFIIYWISRSYFDNNLNDVQSMVSEDAFPVHDVFDPSRKPTTSILFQFQTLTPSRLPSPTENPTLFITKVSKFPVDVNNTSSEDPMGIPTMNPTYFSTMTPKRPPASTNSPSKITSSIPTSLSTHYTLMEAPSYTNKSRMNMMEAFSTLKDEELEKYVKTLEYPQLKVWEDHVPSTCLMIPKTVTYSSNTRNDKKNSFPINEIIQIPLLTGMDRLEYVNIKMKTALEGELRLLRRSDLIYVFARFVGTHIFGLTFYRERNDSNVLIADILFPYLGGDYSLSIITAYSTPISRVGGIRYYEERQEVSPSFHMTIKPENGKPKSNQVYYSLSPNITNRLRNNSLMSTIGLIPQQQINYSFSDGSKYNRTCLRERLKNLKGKICFVGDSHFRYLTCELRYAFENIDYQGVWTFDGYSEFFAFEWARYGFHLENSVRTIRKKNNCSIIFVGAGQWALSSRKRIPSYPVNTHILEIQKFLVSWNNSMEQKKPPLMVLPIEPCS